LVYKKCYSLIKPEDIKNSKSTPPIKCNTCGFIFRPNIYNYIGRKTGCFNCSIGEKWTFERLIRELGSAHREDINYSLIKPENIKNNKSRAPVKCNKCGYEWKVIIASIIYQKSGCPQCQLSNGEKECARILTRLGIKYRIQVCFEENKILKYDFWFMIDEEGYLLEWDGIQHFKIVVHFHANRETFLESQNRDIFKTKTAIENGYNVIRIDYTQLNNAEYHIKKAIELGKELYLSNSELYSWLTEKL
jgi:very-short-patch-repair endonuclease/predicted Zn-ribbon and HTH transcriptional regulator